jgi:ribosomal protein S18 acetylase RimI-like enzyme
MVRPAELADAAAIARVHVETWKTSYRGLLADDFLDSLTEASYFDRWQRGIADRSSRVYVVEDDTGIVGFASGGPERAGESGFEGELYAIYVMSGAQGRGFGRELVRAVVAGLRDMKLSDMIIWVLRDNPSARRFYERLGGKYVRVQPITIGQATLQEVSYCWHALDDVRW